MLEQDYLKNSAAYNFKDNRLKELNEYSSQLIREIIIPKLTKEVNSSKRYASLRQVYYSLIMAQWFKARFSSLRATASSSLQATEGSEAISSRINSGDLTNLTSKDPWSKTTYFQPYQQSFKDGEYNIQEPVHSIYGQAIRSYFSGGISGIAPALIPEVGSLAVVDRETGTRITVLRSIERLATAKNPYLLVADILEASPGSRRDILENLVVRISEKNPDAYIEWYMMDAWSSVDIEDPNPPTLASVSKYRERALV